MDHRTAHLHDSLSSLLCLAYMEMYVRHNSTPAAVCSMLTEVCSVSQPLPWMRRILTLIVVRRSCQTQDVCDCSLLRYRSLSPSCVLVSYRVTSAQQQILTAHVFAGLTLGEYLIPTAN